MLFRSANRGAVRLFTFSDGSFTGGTLAATLGGGYSGGKNFDIASNAGDRFGSAVSLNAAGDRLAVGAPGNAGAANTNDGAGAVRLFTFSDGSFSGAALSGTVGSGYRGAKNVNHVEGLADAFGAAVSLNAAGNLLVVGASRAGGAGAAIFDDTGAVRLFTFSDNNFSGGALAANIGRGYAGGKNINVPLVVPNPQFGISGDAFGAAVSLNAAGDRLAVGAPGDAGAGNTRGSSGAVRLFTFSDGNFSDGALVATIGNGYSGGKNINVALDSSDGFGSGVSLNGAGNRLAVGAPFDFGVTNSSTLPLGAVYLFSGVTESVPAAARSYAYAERAGEPITIRRSDLEAVLAQGTAVSLQASNDITLSSALNVNNLSGNGGAFTLQAGRSILLNQGITTGNGNLTLIGNDTLTNGVTDAHRDAGNASITMAPGAAINAGSGAVDIALRTGAGKTNASSGNITLDSITASSIAVANQGPTAGSNVVINSGAALNASGTGDALVLAAASGGNFVNNAGASALNAPSGRWLVWSTNPAGDTRGGLGYNFKQYNAVFGTTTPAQSTGNGFLYTLAPVITPVLTGATVKTYDGGTVAALTPANYRVTGIVDGDTLTLNTPASGSYDNKNAGSGKTVTATGVSASAANGAAPVYGYTVANTAGGAIGTINPAPLAVTYTGLDKVYDGATTATVTTRDDRLGADVLTINRTAAFVDKNAGTGKTVNVSNVSLTGADAGNYTVSATGSATADISARGITVSANDATKIYGGADPALTFNVGGAGLAGGDTITSVISGALARTPGENVAGNPYAINQGTLATNTNYSISTFTPGRLTITPRALRITADDKSKRSGDPLPPFTATYSGFAFADTPASLGGALAFTTPATATSPAGAYSITPFGQSSANYTISYVNGVLTVTPSGLPAEVLGAITTAHGMDKKAGGITGTGEPPTTNNTLFTLDGPGVNLPPGVE